MEPFRKGAKAVHVPVEEESHFVVSVLNGTNCFVETVDQRPVKHFVFVVAKSAKTASNSNSPPRIPQESPKNPKILLEFFSKSDISWDLLRFSVILLDKDRLARTRI